MKNGITRFRKFGAAAVSAGVLVVAAPAVAPAEAAAAPTVSASGAFLLDSSANKALWSKSADSRRQMASTTKIMTAEVVLSTRGVDLNRLVTVKQVYRDYVAAKGASTADLRTGDKLTVRQLLYGLLLPSGCDAAYALADTFGTGTTTTARAASFIGKMNAKAKSLGMTNTHYDSFDGISAKGANYTTPRDMAKLARVAITDRTFAAVVKSVSTKQRATNGRTYTWYNTNKLLGSYSGAIGIKTGTNTPAGPCLVFAASRNGRVVVGVLLNDTNRFTDAAKLLNYAYSKSAVAGNMLLPKLAPGVHD